MCSPSRRNERGYRPPLSHFRHFDGLRSKRRPQLELNNRAVVAKDAVCVKSREMNKSSIKKDDMRVEVRHRRPPPRRYTWEIFRAGTILPVKESGDQFGSWEEASDAGKTALKIWSRDS